MALKNKKINPLEKLTNEKSKAKKYKMHKIQLID